MTRPAHWRANVVPIRDHALIGDGHTAALVSTQAEVVWWCAPRFHSPPVLDALLGGAKIARLARLGPAPEVRYEEDTNVIHATWHDAQAWFFMPYPRRDASRIIRVLDQAERREAAVVEPDGAVSAMPLDQAEIALDETRNAWRTWIGHDIPPAARRSLLALKLLTDESTGAIVAAPTTSLPEVVGGVRNWDYRYAWIRDTAFCSIAYARWGKEREAKRIASWLSERVALREDPRVLYTSDGETPPDETETDLPGYAESKPVRFGNGAIHQFQLDAYGHMLEAIDVCPALDDGELQRHWPSIAAMVDSLTQRWREPDNGIWEIPAGPRQHVYSKVMAWYALDRAIDLARDHGLDAPTERWAQERERIRAHVLERGIDPRTSGFRQSEDNGAADAALLRVPLVGFLSPDDARVRATVRQVAEELGAGRDLLYRYRSADGLPGQEGAFVACSFWVAEVHALMGNASLASDILAELERRAGPLGLLPEEVDPSTGAFLGNYPQALSHASHLCALHSILAAKEAIT